MNKPTVEQFLMGVELERMEGGSLLYFSALNRYVRQVEADLAAASKSLETASGQLDWANRDLEYY